MRTALDRQQLDHEQMRAYEAAERNNGRLSGRIAATAEERRAIAKSRGLYDKDTALSILGCNEFALRLYVNCGHILKRQYSTYEYFDIAGVTREAASIAGNKIAAKHSARLERLFGLD